MTAHAEGASPPPPPPPRARAHLIPAAEVVTPDGVLRPGWVEVAGERILAVGSGRPTRTADTELPVGTVTAGFVDIHAHGGGGASFTTGKADEAVEVVRFHRHHGTTTLMASLVSAEPEALLRQVDILADLVQEGLLAGVHLEGPWLAPGKRGAHDAHALRDPDPAEIARLLRAGRGAVRMVTLAPERTGGLDAVRQLTEEGVTVAVGHTEADYETTRMAIQAGARVATHLFNAMPPMHHREPGPVLALLEDPRVTLELVADGIHLHPALLARVLATAGTDRVALVTDAMSAAGMSDGRYALGTLDAVVSDGVARLPSGAIAGSTVNAADLFAAAVGALAEGPEPLIGASRVTAATPVAALGLTGVGTVAPDQRADLVVLSPHHSVLKVMARGRWVHR
ncbi:MAG: N-acetylglucosamine-6-phosphate deacetylase [Ornithinimicrobium sp.]